MTLPITKLTPDRLVGDSRLLSDLFPDPEDRPSPRWLRYQMQRGLVPYFKIGRLVRFDPAMVREAFTQNCLVCARSSRRAKNSSTATFAEAA